MDPNDYVTNSPMWFDPGLDFDGVPGGETCAERCNVPRSMWDAANLAVPGTMVVTPVSGSTWVTWMLPERLFATPEEMAGDRTEAGSSGCVKRA